MIKVNIEINVINNTSNAFAFPNVALLEYVTDVRMLHTQLILFLEQ